MIKDVLCVWGGGVCGEGVCLCFMLIFGVCLLGFGLFLFNCFVFAFLFVCLHLVNILTLVACYY